MNDGFQNYHRPEGGDGYHNKNFHSGITSYKRGRGIHNRKNNPYSRSNMIYAKRRRKRKWPYIALTIVVIACLCALAFFACDAMKGQPQEQQTQQQAQQTQASASDSAQEQEQADSQASGEGTTAENSPEQQNDGGDKRVAVSDSRNDVKPDRKVVYLTFDDGPSPNTDKIMKVLDENGVKATWFVIGVTGMLEKIADIWDHGNQIALHTDSHDYAKVYKSTDAFWSEMDKIAEKVEKHLGFKPTLFRFPGGSVNDYNSKISKQLRTQSYEKGYHYFDWNISSTDASPKKRTAEQLLKSIKKNSKGCNSCCVLMHDTQAKDTTVEALPKIIEYYKDAGFEFDVLTSDSFGYHFQEDK